MENAVAVAARLCYMEGRAIPSRAIKYLDFAINGMSIRSYDSLILGHSV